MPRISDINILKKTEQPTLCLRTITKVEDLPALIGESYGKMAAYLKEIGEFLADVPYVAYHNMDMQRLDVEIGFPVSRALPGKEEVKAGLIPAGKVVFCMYRGAYNEIEPVYTEMLQWIEENHHKATGTAYEHYYNGPGFPESEMLTMLVMPII
jgi:effector-binding domain-containing protein